MNQVYAIANDSKPYIELNFVFQEELAKKFGIKFEIDIDINDDDDFEDNNNSHTHKVAIRAKIPNSNQNRSIDGSTYDIKFECFDFDENAQMNAIIFPHSNESNKYQEEDKFEYEKEIKKFDKRLRLML